MQQVDSETAKVLSEGERMANFVKGDDWKFIRDRLTEKIMDLQSILNIDASSTESALADIRARVAAVNILKEWLMQIEGMALQGRANAEAMSEKNNEEIIKYNAEN